MSAPEHGVICVCGLRERGMRLYLVWRAVRPTLCAWFGVATHQPEALAGPRGQRPPARTMTILMNRSPGFPEHGGGPLQAHRLAGDELEIRRQLFLLAVGIAVTFALFLALPLMQVVSSPIQPPPIPVSPGVALQIPEMFIPPPQPKVEKIEQLRPEELVQVRPQPTIDQITTEFGPGGLGTIPVASWNPAETIPEIFTTDKLDRVPTAIYTVAPDVPRGSRYSGTVVLEFIVTPQGSVIGIKVISSTERAFERPAVDALAKWKFEPGVKNNAPVSTRMRLPIRFNVGN
jgi:protein TonB